MSKTPNPRALDRDEADMVEQTKALAERSPAELRDLIGRLRSRRDRVQRQIRGRVRAGESGPDAGAAGVAGAAGLAGRSSPQAARAVVVIRARTARGVRRISVSIGCPDRT